MRANKQILRVNSKYYKWTDEETDEYYEWEKSAMSEQTSTANGRKLLGVDIQTQQVERQAPRDKVNFMSGLK